MPPSMRWSSVNSFPQSCAKSFRPTAASSRAFSSTSRHNATKQRRAMYSWLENQGLAFRDPLPGSTNYLSAYNKFGNLARATGASAQSEGPSLQEQLDKLDGSEENPEDGEPAKASTGHGISDLPPERRQDLKPFPANTTFISPPVLNEDFREAIWKKVMEEGLSVREVSALFKVEMNRVGAVVRLKEIEKEWKRTGKPTADPYATAVLNMLPKTQFRGRSSRHEEINNLPVHEATMVQIFQPTSESRAFTRKDAAKVFDDKLLPADLRIPHPELVEKIRDQKQGFSEEEVDARNRQREDVEIEKRQKILDYRAKKEAEVKRIDTGRWEFRIREANIDHVGADGRGPKGVGWRYGRPHMDRSKGQVKIPTRVE
ncbi:hypothetical protein PVAG01_09116 [Phlyctema vagabunda]|uniref:Ribosomal protein S35, mitochondrial n=1 Tax=Phlyctema vagabunda TaxID=108571 RepID=A0ABR4P6G0_9HELO